MDKHDLSLMSRTAIIPKFKMRWFTNEGRYLGEKLCVCRFNINLVPLMPDEDKTSSGSLVLDLRIEMTPHELTLYISRLKLECYFYVNRTERVYDKVLVTKFCVFLTRRGTIRNL